GQVPVAAAHRVDACGGADGGLAGDVDPGVPAADDEHGLAAQTGAVPQLRGVQDGAAEQILPRVGGQVGDGVVPGGDDDRAVPQAAGGRSGGGLDDDFEAGALDGLDVGDLGAVPDVLGQSEVGGVAL